MRRGKEEKRRGRKERKERRDRRDRRVLVDTAAAAGAVFDAPCVPSRRHGGIPLTHVFWMEFVQIVPMIASQDSKCRSSLRTLC